MPATEGFGTPIGEVVQQLGLDDLEPGDAMLLAAMLFVVGLLIGWSYTMLAVAATSFLILVGALTLFAVGPGLDMLHALIVLGYLTAHQSGYLLGAYCGGCYEVRRNRQTPLP